MKPEHEPCTVSPVIVLSLASFLWHVTHSCVSHRCFCPLALQQLVWWGPYTAWVLLLWGLLMGHCATGAIVRTPFPDGGHLLLTGMGTFMVMSIHTIILSINVNFLNCLFHPFQQWELPDRQRNMVMVYNSRECCWIQPGIVLHSAGGSSHCDGPLPLPDDQWIVRLYLWHMWQGGETRTQYTQQNFLKSSNNVSTCSGGRIPLCLAVSLSWCFDGQTFLHSAWRHWLLHLDLTSDLVNFHQLSYQHTYKVDGCIFVYFLFSNELWLKPLNDTELHNVGLISSVTSSWHASLTWSKPTGERS